MSELMLPTTSPACLKLSFPKAGRYRVVFRFASTPKSKTLVALCGNDNSTLDFANLPLFHESQMDITVAKGPAVLLACHSELEELRFITAPEIIPPYSFGSIFGRIHKKSFISGNIFRIRKTGFGLMTFVRRQDERQSQFQAIWNGIAAENYFTARHSEHHVVPLRHNKPWRHCLLVSVSTEKEILEALKLRPLVDELILTIVNNDLTDRERMKIPDDVKIIFSRDTNDVYLALLRTCRSGQLANFEFVGICLLHQVDGLEARDTSRHGLSNPSKWDLEALFGSKSNVNSIMSVFESDSKVAMVESPLMSLFRRYFANRLSASSQKLNSSPGSAWFRVKSLEAVLPSVFAASEIGRTHSDLQSLWPSLVEQSFSSAGFVTTAKLWADLRDGEPAAVADFSILRSLEHPEARKVCLFVCFAPNGKLRPHAFHFMRELRRMGYLVFALAANDRSDLEIEDPGAEVCDALATRENIGYDFALWAAALTHDPRLFAASELLLVNDSLVGPLLPLDRLFENIKRTDADVVGLVDSYQHKYHCQSFFLLLRRRAIVSTQFNNFVRNVRSFADKDEVIKRYECEFYSTMVKGDMSFDILFKTATLGKRNNPTVMNWRELLAMGFPFIKLQVIQLNPLGDDLSDMEDTMFRHADRTHVESSFRELRIDHTLR